MSIGNLLCFLTGLPDLINGVTMKISTVNATCRTILFMAASTTVIPCKGDQTQTRATLDELSYFCTTSQYCNLSQIAEWGFPSGICGTEPFCNTIAAMSNDWSSLVADWDYYWTNETMRLIIPNIVGFAGTNALLGVWDGLIDICQVDTNRCSAAFIREVYEAATTPLYRYAFINSDKPGVSNLFIRTMNLFPTNDNQIADYFQSVFDSDSREERRFLDNWERFSLEYAMEQLTNSVPQL